MKKLFTLAAAVLASVAMMATLTVPTGTLNPASVPTEGWAGKWAPAYIESGDWVCFSAYEIYQSTQTWAAKDASGSTDGSWEAASPFPASTAWTTNDGKVATIREGQKGPYYYRITNTTEVAALVKSGSNKKRTIFLEAYELTAGVAGETPTKTASMESSTASVISVTGLDATKEYLIVARQEDSGSGGSSSGNSYYYAVAFKTIISTDPTLSVNPATATLAVTAVKTTDEAKVTFTGKNLTDGTYDLSLTSVAGLSVSPTSVTVADGALNQEVTISYESATDVAEAAATLSLTIDEITKSVAITYSAEHAKNYINASVNIEQWVLDNGKKDAALKAVLDAANIDYNSIDALDSLNDEKSNRNYAFLGLKMKKTDASVGCWLQAGSTLKVRFGNVGADFLVRANGVAQTKTVDDLANTTVSSDKELSYTAEADTYLEIVCNSTKTLVIKQIMLNEPIAPVVLPDVPTALDNTEASVKATKRIVNGQLLIEKNGVMYNAQGAVVR